MYEYVWPFVRQKYRPTVTSSLARLLQSDISSSAVLVPVSLMRAALLFALMHAEKRYQNQRHRHRHTHSQSHPDVRLREKKKKKTSQKETNEGVAYE